MAELSFTSKEVIAIINGGCLCTIGRGTCQHHGTAVQRGLDHHLQTGHRPGRRGDDYFCPDCDFTAFDGPS